MGRISDSVPNLLYNWRQSVAKAAQGDVRMGAAVLEYRLIYRRWPRAGDVLQFHSSLSRVEEKFHAISHWAVDPATGAAWITSEAVAVTFDLNTRKVIPTPAAHKKDLARIAPGGLSI